MDAVKCLSSVAALLESALHEFRFGESKNDPQPLESSISAAIGSVHQKIDALIEKQKSAIAALSQEQKIQANKNAAMKKQISNLDRNVAARTMAIPNRRSHNSPARTISGISPLSLNPPPEGSLQTTIIPPLQLATSDCPIPLLQSSSSDLANQDKEASSSKLAKPNTQATIPTPDDPELVLLSDSDENEMNQMSFDTEEYGNASNSHGNNFADAPDVTGGTCDILPLTMSSSVSDIETQISNAVDGGNHHQYLPRSFTEKNTVPLSKNFEYETKTSSFLKHTSKTFKFSKKPQELIFAETGSTNSSACSTLSAFSDGRAIANNRAAIILTLNTGKESVHADSDNEAAITANENKKLRKRKLSQY